MYERPPGGIPPSGNLASNPLTTAEATNVNFMSKLLLDNETMIIRRAKANDIYNREVTFINSTLLASNAVHRQTHINAAAARRDLELNLLVDGSFISVRRAEFARNGDIIR